MTDLRRCGRGIFVGGIPGRRGSSVFARVFSPRRKVASIVIVGPRRKSCCVIRVLPAHRPVARPRRHLRRPRRVFWFLGRRVRTPLHPARVGRAWGPGRLWRLWRLWRPGRLGLVRAAECPYLGHWALGCLGRGRVLPPWRGVIYLHGRPAHGRGRVVHRHSSWHKLHPPLRGGWRCTLRLRWKADLAIPAEHRRRQARRRRRAMEARVAIVEAQPLHSCGSTRAVASPHSPPLHLSSKKNEKRKISRVFTLSARS
jgi:hypothetical protein